LLIVEFNGQKANVVGVTETAIKAEVPLWASSGIVTITVGSQILPGPKFKVAGNVSIDNTFKSYVGANNIVRSITALPDGRMVIVGDFTDYNNVGTRAGYGRLAIISEDGTIDKSFRLGSGIPSGSLNHTALLQDGKILVGGSIASFNNKKNKIGNILKLSLTGVLDSTVYSYFNKMGEIKKDTVPGFNAFFSNEVNRMMVQPDGNVLVIGNFKYYMRKTYYPDQKDTIITDSVVVNNVARISPSGELDKTYNFNVQANESNNSFNGSIREAYMMEDGKMLAVGNFSAYNGEAVNKIARINLDGTLDKTFNIGSGPSGQVYCIRPYPGGKLLVSGEFLTFNGKPMPKVVLLNSDGSVDEGFNTGIGPDGIVNRAVALANGKILITGNFQKFNNINRYGFAILEPNGTLSPGNNTMGGFIFADNTFRSPVQDVLNVEGQNASILVGSFNSLDLQQNNRLVKITY